MKTSNRLQNWLKTALGTFMLLAALTVGLEMTTIVSLADSTGKITATSAKIRKEPSTSSDTVGSAAKDANVDVTGQTQGSDGYTWYKVRVDGEKVGYIRADLMKITDGSNPPSVSGTSSTTTTTSTPTTSTPDEPLVEVSKVEPVSAKISGGSSVRVRQNASTTSRIVSTAQSGLALTVVGEATGKDNKDWYQVTFISNGSEVSGFIRADYVSVSGELVPEGSATTQTPETPAPETTEPEAPVEEKLWETYYTENDNKWHLVDNSTKNSYDIAQIFSAVEANTQTLQDTLKENKTQQIVIVILVILVILLATGVSFLIFKMKDMADSAYYREVEQETVRRRTADRPVSRNQGNQKVMTDVNRRPAGGQRPTGGQGQRPVGQRPAGAQGGQGQRPVGQRPAGAQGSQGQRPVGQRPAGTQGGQGQRPVSQRPAGAQDSQGQRPVGQRPAGAQGSQGQRPVSQRPAGAQSGQGQRPVGQRPAGAQGSQGQRPVGQRPVEMQQRPVQPQEYVQEDVIEYQEIPVQDNMNAQNTDNTGWKSKNFANEDEFEFQFLDYNEDGK